MLLRFLCNRIWPVLIHVPLRAVTIIREGLFLDGITMIYWLRLESACKDIRELICHGIHDIFSIWRPQFELGRSILLFDADHGRHHLKALRGISYLCFDEQEAVVHQRLWGEELRVTLDNFQNAFLDGLIHLQAFVQLAEVQVLEDLQARRNSFLFKG